MRKSLSILSEFFLRVCFSAKALFPFDKISGVSRRNPLDEVRHDLNGKDVKRGDEHAEKMQL